MEELKSFLIIFALVTISVFVIVFFIAAFRLNKLYEERERENEQPR